MSESKYGSRRFITLWILCGIFTIVFVLPASLGLVILGEGGYTTLMALTWSSWLASHAVTRRLDKPDQPTVTL